MLSNAGGIRLEAITANQQANAKVILAGHPRQKTGYRPVRRGLSQGQQAIRERYHFWHNRFCHAFPIHFHYALYSIFGKTNSCERINGFILNYNDYNAILRNTTVWRMKAMTVSNIWLVITESSIVVFQHKLHSLLHYTCIYVFSSSCILR